MRSMIKLCQGERTNRVKLKQGALDARLKDLNVKLSMVQSLDQILRKSVIKIKTRRI